MCTILIGPMGSGKTTYADSDPSLADAVRICQDDLGKVGHLKAFLEVLPQRENVVVDRINHLREQRARYIVPAREAGYRIKFIWLDVDRPICLKRLSERKDHPTIKLNANHGRILGTYFRAFERPEPSEYDEIDVVKKRTSGRLLDLRKVIGDSKFLVVGDIHGCFDEFLRLLAKCGYQDGNFVISVGDLVDRGPKSREVLEWFLNTPNAYVVQGNHDNKIARYWRGNKVQISHGIDKTIEQCEGMDTESFAGWIESWPYIIQLPDFDGRPSYVVHAGVNGRFPMESQPLENCLYARYFGGKDFFDEEGGKIWYSTLDGSYNILSGHMIHSVVQPEGRSFVYLLDGGAWKGGELKAFVKNPDQQKVVSVNSINYEDNTDDVTKRDALIAHTKLLRCADLGDLRIYTYTDNCVHEGQWNDVTLNSRGIILNRKTGEIVAQPFSKFFNVNEREDTRMETLPWDSGYQVFEKMDGWLGTLYRYNGEHRIATRGSFDGMGVGTWATNMLSKHNLSNLPDEVTLMFELICPQTKIIVDYGGEEKLVLTAAFNRHTNEEYDWTQVEAWASEFGFELPRAFGNDIEECQRFLNKHDGTELEGFVIRFSSGLRVKIKGEDYRRRAAIVAHLSPLSIWRTMENGKVDTSTKEALDADYVELFDKYANELERQYRSLRQNIWKEYNAIVETFKAGSADNGWELDRKKFAQHVFSGKPQYPNMMFAMLDQKEKSVERFIMDRIRPTKNDLKVD